MLCSPSDILLVQNLVPTVKWHIQRVVGDITVHSSVIFVFCTLGTYRIHVSHTIIVFQLLKVSMLCRYLARYQYKHILVLHLFFMSIVHIKQRYTLFLSQSHVESYMYVHLYMYVCIGKLIKCKLRWYFVVFFSQCLEIIISRVCAHKQTHL